MGVPAEEPEDINDTAILKQAKKRGLIILTGDRQLVERAQNAGIGALLIPHKQDITQQLATVVKQYSLPVEGFEERTLCTKCGGRLVLVNSGAVAGRVPEGVKERFEDFLECSRCGQIYWEGSHWQNINDTIDRVRTCI